MGVGRWLELDIVNIEEADAGYQYRYIRGFNSAEHVMQQGSIVRKVTGRYLTYRNVGKRPERSSTI